MSKKITEIIGWYGAVAILLAYALVSFKAISSQSYMYQLLNLTGALGISAVSFAKKAKQPALLNVVWAVVAFVAIIGLIAK
jgi:hypothetical protein